MLVDSSNALVLGLSTVWLLAKILLFILGVFYFIFTLVVVQQVRLMTHSLITEVSPLLRTFSLLQVGLGLAVLVLLFGLLFGH